VLGAGIGARFAFWSFYGEYAAENHGGNSMDECGMNNIRRNSGQPVRQSFLEDKSAEVHIH